ncbi:zinc finger matrin-type protein 3-like [Hetaerina americana]|uniref:zinc finger matrin-type protein 3-like n=1 Tax=Hetaerina americana TaxID=62018 RepID=UPI003A7F182E
MDTKNYDNPYAMDLPPPYIQPQISEHFVTQIPIQEDHGKPLMSPVFTYFDEQPTSPINDKDMEEIIVSKDLPEELVSQFSPRHCDLCTAQMNSALQSRMHYHGKQHQKKVAFFMNNWEKEHGGSYPKKIVKDDAVDCLKTPGDKKLYCEWCDLSLTSHLHAQQHYRGRNHQRVVNGLQPLRSGYYNKLTCKWQRFPPMEGVYGSRPSEPMFYHDLLSSELMVHSSEKPSEKREDPGVKRGRFFCELCNIGATSQGQLNIHFKGGKHKKAERMLIQLNLLMEDDDMVKAPPADSILASVTTESEKPKKYTIKDFSIYRTPSGRFYCQLCNLTVQSELQFIQHLDSKKHRITTGPRKCSAGGFQR